MTTNPKGWWATASTWQDNRDEAYCEDAEALKEFIDKHADDEQVTLIRIERNVVDL